MDAGQALSVVDLDEKCRGLAVPCPHIRFGCHQVVKPSGRPILDKGGNRRNLLLRSERGSGPWYPREVVPLKQWNKETIGFPPPRRRPDELKSRLKFSEPFSVHGRHIDRLVVVGEQ